MKVNIKSDKDNKNIEFLKNDNNPKKIYLQTIHCNFTHKYIIFIYITFKRKIESWWNYSFVPLFISPSHTCLYKFLKVCPSTQWCVQVCSGTWHSLIQLSGIHHCSLFCMCIHMRWRNLPRKSRLMEEAKFGIVELGRKFQVINNEANWWNIPTKAIGLLIH